tara:strand:- start:760 stop:1893 length:1134 start_codon:yes stop_codon:yes gene_type:complete
MNYSQLMRHALSLRFCVILSTGRTGSDFLQSLLDSHPQILGFNGILFFHDFWNSSKCVKANKVDPSDFIDEFIGVHIEKFKSRYDLQENKDRLGINRNESINIHIPRFRKHFINLLNDYNINSRNALIAIYTAYSLCFDQDIMCKKVLIHHIHHYFRLPQFFRDFPGSKIISTTRDPRANLVSSVLHWRQYTHKIKGSVIWNTFHKIQRDEFVEREYNGYDHVAVRLEDLGNKETLMKLAKWLCINYDESMEVSTFGGLVWHGDRLSVGKRTGIGFSKELAFNDWEKILPWKDKYIINILMHKRLEYYGYAHKNVGIFGKLFAPFLIILPLKFEKGHILGGIKGNFFSYLRRVKICFKLYFDMINNRKFIVMLIDKY